MPERLKHLCACGHGTADEDAMWDHLKTAHGGSGLVGVPAEGTET